MATFTAGASFSDGVTGDVTAAKLNALVANATPLSNLITDRTAKTSVVGADIALIADSADSNNLKKVTITNLANNLPTAKITTGTIDTGTFGTTTSTAGSVTTGTIVTGTFGTTTSTAATITTGTIPTLIATTLVTTGTGTAASPAIVPTGDTNTGIFFPAADTIAASTSGAEAMRIDSSGNVGIGTNSFSKKLVVSSNLSTAYSSSDFDRSSSLLIQNSNTSTNASVALQFLIGSNDEAAITAIKTGEGLTDLAFGTRGGGSRTERLRIDSSGNVGIGTNSPQSNLHIAGASAVLRIQDTDTVGNGSNNLTSYIDFRDSAGNQTGYMGFGGDPSLDISNITNAPIRFGTNGSERLRIDSSGNVLVGTTSATIGGGSALGSNGIGLSGAYNNNYGFIANSTNSTSVQYFIAFQRAGSNCGSITSSGANSTSYNTSSDYRLKTNLEPISNGIDRLKQLPVYRFNWLADINGNKVDGFVAHEAQAIVPECVTGEKDAVDADGNPVYQGIDQSKIVPLLTAALKEAISKIELLESKVAALEAA